MTVRAFQPRKIDPPQFVAETIDELAERVGEYIGGGPCDGCGNYSYQIRADARLGRYVAVCAADPDEDPEVRHPDPCGTAYPIQVWDEDLVAF
jgi:hypothetical protein